MRFENKVVVITGASSGVGRAASVMAAKEGAKVYAVARREERLLSLADEVKSIGCTGEIVPVTCDVSKKKTWKDFLKKLKMKMLSLTCLLQMLV